MDVSRGNHKEILNLIQMIYIIRDAIHFRYRLIPYLYLLSYESHIHGSPIIRPLLYEFQDDPTTYDISFDFMLGPSLLISSVTEPNSIVKTVYLPGTSNDYWYDFWNDEIFHGNQYLNVNVPLSQHGAVFAKHGSLIPMGKSMNFIGSEPDNYRIIRLYPMVCKDDSESFESSITLYEDDGYSNDQGQCLIKVIMKSHMKSIQVGLEPEFKGFIPSFTEILFRLPAMETRKVECIHGKMKKLQNEYLITI